jgi:hypothetical protein
MASKAQDKSRRIEIYLMAFIMILTEPFELAGIYPGVASKRSGDHY